MESKQISVAAVYTAPRYENVYCRNAIELALRDAKIPLNISQGVFYGQCMQNLISNIIDQADVILTLDGDSLFNAGHVMRLLSVLISHDEIDALAAIQARRGKNGHLFSLDARETVTIGVHPDSPFRVKTAHFGLTAIKTAKLKPIPKPWFAAVPGPGGSWEADSGKIDDDVYFWKQWDAAGNTVYVDPGCRIGHCEEMISYYDDRLQVRACYPAEWHDMQREKIESARREEHDTDSRKYAEHWPALQSV